MQIQALCGETLQWRHFVTYYISWTKSLEAWSSGRTGICLSLYQSSSKNLLPGVCVCDGVVKASGYFQESFTTPLNPSKKSIN